MILLLRCLQHLAQPCEAGEHPALHGTQRHAEALGELGCGAPVVGQLDRLPLPVGERPQRCLDAIALEAEPGRVRRRARGRRPPAIGCLERLGAPTFLRRTRSTARRWTSVRIQVLALARSGRKRRGRAPDGEEALLHGVLREAVVAKDPEREP